MCVCRVELSDAVENVDMSLEELQHLLLRSHQQNTAEPGSSSVMDVSRYVPHTHTHTHFCVTVNEVSLLALPEPRKVALLNLLSESRFNKVGVRS